MINMIYCFARPNQMKGHRFTDDVAICRALSKKQAIKKFNRLYDYVTKEEVFKVKFYGNYFPMVLTDY